MGQEIPRYRDEYAGFPYQDLLQVRDQLIRDIMTFEKEPAQYLALSEAESPYQAYLLDLLHLSEICLMIEEEYVRINIVEGEIKNEVVV